MKICHILGSLGMGGAERVALDLGVAQSELGHDVSFLVLAPIQDAPMEEEFRASGLRLHEIAKQPGLDFRLPVRIGRHLRKNEIEVAHTHNTLPLVYAAASARTAGCRVVHTKHGEGHLVSRGSQLLRRAAAPFVHRFVCVSEATREHAIAQKAYPYLRRLSVIPNGIRLERHQPSPKRRADLRRELGISSTAFVVGTIGRVDKNKNQASLIAAMEDHLSDDLHLVIVGDGVAFDDLVLARSKSNHSSQIHLLGRRNDANEVMNTFDLFALPSLSEGLPLVLLEAMATMVPVLSTAVGGIPDVISHEETGLLVPHADPKQLQEAILRVRDNPKMAGELALRAHALVEASYSAKSMAADYLKLYR